MRFAASAIQSVGRAILSLNARSRTVTDRHVRPTGARGAFTLVELLVVVMIMVILLGIAIPAIKPALKDRKIREASRQLNAFIRAAQSRAAETNRSVGVWFARTDDNPNVCYQLYFAETPPPYVGDTTGARAVFSITDIWNPPNDPSGIFVKWVGTGVLSESWSAAVGQIVQSGDLIQFNYSGSHYVITSISFNTTTQETEFTFEALPTDIRSLRRAGAPRHLESTTTPPVNKQNPFQITRKPQRSSAGSLSLPNTTAVILSLSGFNGIIARQNNQLTDDRNEFDSTFASTQAGITSPVVVMFRPDGSVERVYYGDSTLGVLPDAPIHFLVGRAEVDERLDPEMQNPQAQPPFAPPNSETLTLPAGRANPDPLLWQNLNDVANLWVVVGDRTGTITTSAMQDWKLVYDSTHPDRNTLVKKTRDARSLAATGLSVGGK